MMHLKLHDLAQALPPLKEWILMELPNSSLSAVSLLAYFFLCSLTSPSAAEDISLTGTWRHKADKAEAVELAEAIDGATREMGLLMRGRAREYLREATQPWKELTLTIEGDQLTFSSNDRSINWRARRGYDAGSIQGREVVHDRRW